MTAVHKVAGIAARMMAMNDATWDRHTNPWSGWSRVALLPLLALAIWSRLWIGWWAVPACLAVGLFTWLNPRLFPPPASHDNWMSRGVLGERIWLESGAHGPAGRHAPILRWLTAASSVGVILLLAGTIRYDPGLTLAGLVLSMGGKLWFLDRMVWLYEDSARQGRDPSPATHVEQTS